MEGLYSRRCGRDVHRSTVSGCVLKLTVFQIAGNGRLHLEAKIKWIGEHVCDAKLRRQLV
jgi:hypothetical protein